jgi:hypothetical protein
MTCKTHPDAPHGFDRNGSHAEDRYVCMCEHWEPPQPRALVLADQIDAIENDGADPDLVYEAAAELRLLHTSNEQLRQQNTLLDKTLAESDALLRQALEALENRCGTNAEERRPDGVITTIKERLNVLQ